MTDDDLYTLYGKQMLQMKILQAQLAQTEQKLVENYNATNSAEKSLSENPTSN